MTAPDFVLLSGSVRGRLHQRLDLPNQDAAFFEHWPDGLAAVLCDGCGSARDSATGAVLLSRLTVASLARHRHMLHSMTGLPVVDAYLEQVRQDVLSTLRSLVAASGAGADRLVGECLLCTILGLAVVGPHTIIFGLGDGLLTVNGEIRALGPFPDNAPPYLAYALAHGVEAADERLRFTCHALLATEDVTSIMLGTDGVADALAAEHAPLPGTDEPFGLLRRFWDDATYERHPDLLRRRLARANRAVPGVPGLLPDDTTLVVLRRRAVPDGGG